MLSAVGGPLAMITKPIITPHLGTTTRAVHIRRTSLHVLWLYVAVAVFFVLQFLHEAFVARLGTDLSVQNLKVGGFPHLVFLVSDTRP